MQLTIASILAVAAVVPKVTAHYNFDKLVVGSTTTNAYEYIRLMTTYNSPVTSVSSTDLRCNVGTQANAASTKVYKVTAGSTVGFTVADSIGHPGPLAVYMSKSTTSSVTTYDGSGDWFKIYQLGVKTYGSDTAGITWQADGLTSVSFKIPTAIPNGEYLLRIEHIGLHGASTSGGAQFYISCAQIEITGGSGGTPSPVGKIPGIYTASDPGLLINIYWPPVTSYTLPGPAVYSG